LISPGIPLDEALAFLCPAWCSTSALRASFLFGVAASHGGLCKRIVLDGGGAIVLLD